MAGEIQLNSTTVATESSGAITLSNVNSATNRTNLGLGSIATQASDSISISGGNITGGTLGSSVVFPAGHVIQTVMSAQITASTTSNTDVDVGSYSITTTVANSKIYIIMTLMVNGVTGNGVNNFINMSLKDGSTTLLNGFAIVGAHSSPDMRGVATWNYLYSPNVTAGSTVTFDLKINANLTTQADISSNPSPSHITFMEIAP